MKKITLLLSTAFLFFASATMAQRGEVSPEKQKAMYKDSLSISDALADSMVALDTKYREKMIEMHQNAGEDRDAMRQQMKAITEERNAEVKKILPADAFVKYQTMEANRRAQMRNRMGGRD